jgi:plasmid maintenance system killer protein
LDTFKDDSIQRIAINLKDQEINIRLEGLPLFKLNLLKQILKSEELNFIESDLVEKDEGFFGNLLVQYET